jgi:hypothetical protein
MQKATSTNFLTFKIPDGNRTVTGNQNHLTVGEGHHNTVEHKGKSQSCQDLCEKPAVPNNIKTTTSASSLYGARTRKKYGHVQSKVKQFIDELQKTDREKQRKLFVKSKSLPFPNESTSLDDTTSVDHPNGHDTSLHTCPYAQLVQDQAVKIATLEATIDVCKSNQEMAREEIERLRDVNDKLLRESEKRKSLANVYFCSTKITTSTQTVSPLISPISLNDTSIPLVSTYFKTTNCYRF